MIKKAIECDNCSETRTFTPEVPNKEAREEIFEPLGWIFVMKSGKKFDFCHGCVQSWDNIEALLVEMKKAGKL